MSHLEIFSNENQIVPELVFNMTIQLMLAALLFFLPSYICGFKIETENLSHIDASDGLDEKHDDKTSRPVLQTVESREARELTDNRLCTDLEL